MLLRKRNLRFLFIAINCGQDIGVRGLMRGLLSLLQCNQEPLVVKDKVGIPPGELVISKPVNGGM